MGRPAKPIPPTRECRVCGSEQPIDSFPWSKRGVSRRRICKPCYSKQQAPKVKARYHSNPEPIRQRMRDVRAERKALGLPEQRIIRPEDYPEHRRLYWQRQRTKLRADAFAAYGGAFCACCGEREDRFLSLDHINNNGNEERRLDRQMAGVRLCRALRKRGFPPGYQVLCFNCNIGRHHNGGICPHKSSEP
jgi:hypothetical protein